MHLSISKNVILHVKLTDLDICLANLTQNAWHQDLLVVLHILVQTMDCNTDLIGCTIGAAEQVLPAIIMHMPALRVLGAVPPVTF